MLFGQIHIESLMMDNPTETRLLYPLYFNIQGGAPQLCERWFIIPMNTIDITPKNCKPKRYCTYKPTER